MIRFGDHLRKLRQAQSFSLDDLASATGISRAYLWKLERKPNVNPSLDCLQKLASALGTTVGDLAVDKNTAEVPQVPASLLECQKAYDLTAEDLADLARIRFRGGHPTDKDDWYALYLQLKRAIGDQG